MVYRVIYSDLIEDKIVTTEVTAKSVFDAIDAVTDTIDNPEETELIEAVPVLQ